MEQARGKLMLASFLTLVASGIGFATRTAAGGPWEREFDLGGGDFGAILGAGFLGFGLMIFFGGILVEKFGYKKLLVLAFVLHLVSAAMLFAANPLFDGWRESDPENATKNVFNVLFWSAFLFSICQGLYEAVINPLIAQIYPENKTHYLNILHAGWPAGMIIGGLFAAGFIGENCWFVELPWQWALSSFAIFVIAYGVLILPEKLPDTVGESSGSFAAVFSCFASVPFLVLIVLHALIGYMELGVDSWMTKLMENLLPNSVLILVYTSALMFILRFFAGPIVHKVNPIGLLFGSSVIACLGLLWLGSPIQSVGMIFVAATFYSLGKAFLWPTMLGVAGERYPQSGSVAMGALGAAGMLCVGQIAGPRIGTQQGFEMSQNLQAEAAETFERYADPEPVSSWGYEYRPLNAAKLNAANGTELAEGEGVDASAISNATLIPEEEKEALVANADTDIPAVQASYLYGGRQALTLTAYVPAMMAVGFLGLMIYFKSIGGYKVITLGGEEKDHESADDALDQPVPSEY
ncbi:MFS transporter [Stieleria sp. JC731]|uniref:MFS transporter n=1 Tax=Pirellulaceae TaxID=2691357 RepID=UPI001E55BC56|nr:MFS transporter [Stieleria sp. JC731]MCC9600071.1 MFS transporter [Stieleria sp. JC731]